MIRVFVKYKILSIETTLITYTHTHMHARTHAHTHRKLCQSGVRSLVRRTRTSWAQEATVAGMIYGSVFSAIIRELLRHSASGNWHHRYRIIDKYDHICKGNKFEAAQ